MDRTGKAEAIKSLEGVIADSGSVIVARYTGLTVAEMTEFRGKLREQGATAKVKDNEKLVIIGGMMGEEVLDAAGVSALSKMPSREEQIATIVARLLGQASQLGSRINAPGQGLAGAINAIGEQAAA